MNIQEKDGAAETRRFEEANAEPESFLPAVRTRCAVGDKEIKMNLFLPHSNLMESNNVK